MNDKSTDNRPLVSVVIPCYNAEKYVRHCLENVMAQTYQTLETIVVNDGSVDRTEEIASQFPVKIIAFPENRGLSAARNAGMDAASGKYIHFMDVDDEITPDFYSTLLAARQNDDPDVICAGMYNSKRLYKCQIFKDRAHRFRRRMDARHSRHLIKSIARERGILIPATSYSPWRVIYFFRKQYYNIIQMLSFK
jgi:glycosyltransferase involved in cell wall biosynthesis